MLYSVLQRLQHQCSICGALLNRLSAPRRLHAKGARVDGGLSVMQLHTAVICDMLERPSSLSELMSVTLFEPVYGGDRLKPIVVVGGGRT
eukprot:scaffold294231_cov37-Tisochrysis_lutea.AAC.2